MANTEKKTKHGMVKKSTVRRGGMEVKEEVRGGDESDMSAEETKRVLKDVEAICKREKLGCFFLLSEVSKDDTGTEMRATLYSNNIKPDLIHKTFHDAFRGMNSGMDVRGGIEAIELDPKNPLEGMKKVLEAIRKHTQ